MPKNHRRAPIFCSVCGSPLRVVPTAPGRLPKYCSTNCRVKAHYVRRALVADAPPVALYMARDSIMRKLLPADCVWDIDRDARRYRGSSPVVAAPPCAGYSAKLCHLAAISPVRDSCAPRAVQQVRRSGGVLEHPAYSHLWGLAGLPSVGGFDRDAFGGFSLELDQWRFGHPARKLTWLYVVGCDPCSVWALLPPSRRYRSGTGLDIFGVNGGSRKFRSAYPLAFAEFLVAVARLCRSPAS